MNLTQTLKKTAEYLQEHGPNEHRTGRKTAHSIPDIINQGQGKMMSGDSSTVEDSTTEGDDSIERPVEPEDLIVE